MTPFHEGISLLKGIVSKGLWIPMGILVVISSLILQFLFGFIPAKISGIEQKQAIHTTEILQLKTDSQELKNDVKIIKGDVGYIRGILEGQQQRKSGKR